MILHENVLCIGDRIEIAKLTSKNKKVYPSQILNIIDEKEYLISGPIYKKNLIMMHKGENIKVSYTVKNKGRYSFEAIILERNYRKIYQLKIKRMSETTRDQRRRFYRFDIGIAVIKKYIINGRIKIEECRTKNISGSGLKLYSNFNHRIGDIIECKFQINSCIIESKCRIIRIEQVDTLNYTYCLGVDFIRLGERDRDKIIKFIFLRERLLREKELM